MAKYIKGDKIKFMPSKWTKEIAEYYKLKCNEICEIINVTDHDRYSIYTIYSSQNYYKYTNTLVDSASHLVCPASGRPITLKCTDPTCCTPDKPAYEVGDIIRFYDWGLLKSQYLSDSFVAGDHYRITQVDTNNNNYFILNMHDNIQMLDITIIDGISSKVEKVKEDVKLNFKVEAPKQVPTLTVVMINELGRNTPAQRVGMIKGDIIRYIDDQPVTTLDEFSKQIANKCEVSLIVERNDRRFTTKCEVQDFPPHSTNIGATVIEQPWIRKSFEDNICERCKIKYGTKYTNFMLSTSTHGVFCRDCIEKSLVAIKKGLSDLEEDKPSIYMRLMLGFVEPRIIVFIVIIISVLVFGATKVIKLMSADSNIVKQAQAEVF